MSPVTLGKPRLPSTLGWLSVAVGIIYSFAFVPLMTGRITVNEERLYKREPHSVEGIQFAGGSDGTAACLLIMDDNHFLIEWLAFHYYVLRLRYLIVAVDARSTTSPDAVLRRWKGRMSVEIWHAKERYFDAKVMKENKEREISGASTIPNETLSDYLALQRKFNLKCLATHKRNGRGWTFLTDTDEYIHINPRIRDSSDDFYLPKWKRLPSIQEPDSVYKILMQLTIPDISPGMFHPCVRIARRQFSADDSGQTVYNVSERFPNKGQGFNPKNFQTTRWRRWGFHDPYHPALPGKTIIDLNRLRISDVAREENNGDPHNPLSAICPARDIFAGEDKALLLANHYMGSREQWSSRPNDARGHDCMSALYDYQNSIVGKFESDDLSPWLAGFFNSTETHEAENLLQGRGVGISRIEPLQIIKASIRGDQVNPADVPGYFSTSSVVHVGTIVVPVNYNFLLSSLIV